MRWITVSATVAIATCLLLGCSSSDSVSSDDIVSVRSAWNMNVTLSSELHVAHERLIEQCLEDQGYTDHPELPPPAENEDQAMSVYAPRPSVEDASDFGFREWVPNVFDSGMAADDGMEESEGTAGMDNEYYAARVGESAAEATLSPESPEVPRNSEGEALEWPGKEIHEVEQSNVISWYLEGCAGDVNAEIFGEDVYEFKRMEALATSGPWESIPDNPQVVEANIEWSECLADKGFPDIAEPLELLQTLISMRNDKLYSQIDTDGRGIPESAYEDFEEAQIELAVADAKCNDRTAHYEVIEEKFNRNLALGMDEHEVELFEYQDQAQEYLEAMQKALSQ